MEYIINNLPGHENISDKLGNGEERRGILKRYQNCKIVLSYASEDWRFVEAVASQLRIYFSHSETYKINTNEGSTNYIPNVFCYTNERKQFEWISRKKNETDKAFNERNNAEATACFSQILEQANVLVLFAYNDKIKAGPTNIAGAGNWQVGELETWIHTRTKEPSVSFKIDLHRAHDSLDRNTTWKRIDRISQGKFESITADAYDLSSAEKVAEKILRKYLFDQPTEDYYPISSVFSYEKDIVQLYQEIPSIIKVWLNNPEDTKGKNLMYKLLAYIKQGIPPFWPSVPRQADFRRTRPNPLTSINENTNQAKSDADIGRPRVGLDMLWPIDGVSKEYVKNNQGMRTPDLVTVAALSKYLQTKNSIHKSSIGTFSFPEAGPRNNIYTTTTSHVAIVVSGGIAPGINAVIDGIVGRHKKYNESIKILGISNGFYTLSKWDRVFIKDLDTSNTSARVTEGGSCLQTCRLKALLPTPDLDSQEDQIKEIDKIVDNLRSHNIKILYVIGGDGSMRAAHKIAQACRKYDQFSSNDISTSVIGIPKTMDNDILWVWQTFGFATAVEKAREIIEHLATEVEANPRICVLQLFGSASGFVVSHAVVASRAGTCDFALIPEAPFSIDTLAWELAIRMVKDPARIIPYGLIVMAESAIPIKEDCEKYLDKVGLTKKEGTALNNFIEYREINPNSFPDGQISNDLRSAGLKLVSEGIKIRLIELFEDEKFRKKLAVEVDMQQLPDIQVNDQERFRIFSNEPRHLLRSVPPSFSDVIMGSRLGALAVDNAMAGYTDFMISQWLTEFVLVPLELVALGRKHIPQDGIFWKSVLAKTEQGDLSRKIETN